jgi:hypothetical protein
VHCLCKPGVKPLLPAFVADLRGVKHGLTLGGKLNVGSIRCICTLIAPILENPLCMEAPAAPLEPHPLQLIDQALIIKGKLQIGLWRLLNCRRLRLLY